MMALRKEPRRRYGSAELLAEDLGRYLRGLPVVARHPSRAYYLSKFLRRHRTAASLGTIAVLSLVASTAVAVKQTATARRERDRATAALTQARQALRESDETTSFLAGLFDVNVPAPGGAAPGTTEELIARGMGQIAQLDNRPLVQARMLEGIGRIYQNAGRFAEAKEAYDRSLVLRRANGAGESSETATTLLHMANTLRVAGSYAAADSAAWQALRIYEKVNGPADPSVAEAWQMLSMLAVYRSDIRATAAYARRSADIMIAAYGADDPRIAHSLEILGGAMNRLGRYEEGERYMRQALVLYEREKGPNDPELILPLYRLAEAMVDSREDYAGAAPLMERGTAIAKSIAWRCASADGLCARVPRRAGVASRQLREGERLSRQAVEIAEKALGRRDVSVADAAADLAKVYSRVGRWTEAEAAQRTAMAVFDNALGRAHAMYAGAMAGLCEIHLHAGRLAEADAECRESLAIRQRALGPRNLGLLSPLMLLGDMQAGAASSPRRTRSTRPRCRSSRSTRGEQPRPHESLYSRIAVLRDLQHRPAEAAELRRKAGGSR